MNDDTVREIHNLDAGNFYQRELGLGLIFRNGWAEGGLCPFHDDQKAGSFRVHEDGGYICYSCEAKGGDIIAFVMARYNCTFREAVKAICESEGIQEIPQAELKEMSDTAKRRVLRGMIHDLYHASLMVSIAANDLAKGKRLSNKDHHSLVAAADTAEACKKVLESV